MRIYRSFLCHASFLSGDLLSCNEEINTTFVLFLPIIYKEPCDVMLLAKFSLECVSLKRKLTFDVVLLMAQQRSQGICTLRFSAECTCNVAEV